MRLGLGPVFACDRLIATRRWQLYALRSGFLAVILLGMWLAGGPFRLPWDPALISAALPENRSTEVLHIDGDPCLWTRRGAAQATSRERCGNFHFHRLAWHLQRAQHDPLVVPQWSEWLCLDGKAQ